MRKTCLITGGAGSLGRAFIRYLNDDYDLIVVDCNEWAVAEARHLYPDVTFKLCDFTEYTFTGMEDLIVHAAAYKHVDLGESNVASFITNNLTKTIAFYEKAHHTLARVLYISTDKAVEPSSAYGATKYLAECLTREIGGSVARLGNILESSGSVIPTWEAQIAKQSPITITDPMMTRYMIDDDDAVEQIWEQFLQGRQLIIPDMGEPVRILDMMGEVLKRHGYEKPSDYHPGVEVIGLRPGEKMHEKLIWPHETLTPTHE